MHVPLAQQQDELALGPLGIDQGDGQGVKGQVPGRIPGILPLVGHGEHVQVVQVRPVGIAALLAALGRGWLGRIALQPQLDAIVVELLAPHQPGQGLPLNLRSSSLRSGRLDGGIELVRLGDALLQRPAQSRQRDRRVPCRKSAPAP